MEGLPPSLAERLQALEYSERAVAYLQIDAGLILVGAGGHLENYGLAAVRLGEPAVEQASFLEGLLPLVETPYLVSSVELAGGRATDIHFHLDADTVWVLMLDVTATRDAARRMQQKAYEMTLLQEKEALLNRRLEAANLALRATQRELEASRDLALEQAQKLADQAKELAAWNATLEERVAAQVGEIERVSRLKRFLSPQIADLVAASDEAQNLLESHRREVTVLFCDLRGFTSFTEIAEPEEVMKVLNEYHHTVGELIDRYEGTLERFLGDGLLTLFNDPLPCKDHTERAVRMALDMRASLTQLAALWRKRGHELGFGMGLALGYATLGRIGFERRFDYSAVGSVTNLASRLCDQAKSGQILVEARVYNELEGLIDALPLAQMTLKGFRRPVEAFEILGLAAGSN